MRRAIYECVSLSCCNRCTIRTHGRKPDNCPFAKYTAVWVRIDKHKPEVEEYAGYHIERG